MGVAETLLKENSNRVEILSKILPQMASAADARMLVAKLLDNNKTEIQKLRREIGFALKPMLGTCFSTVVRRLLRVTADRTVFMNYVWRGLG
jgi:hypothetical protein